MFGVHIGSISEGVEIVQKSQNLQDFEDAISGLCDYLIERKYDPKYVKGVESRAYLLPNEYSQSDTQKRLSEAKKKVVPVPPAPWYQAHAMAWSSHKTSFLHLLP